MASDLVYSASSDKLTEMDWTKNIEICEIVARDPRIAKDVVKAIKKRLGNKNPNVQLYAVLLLEMLMNNLGEVVHKQVIDAAVLPVLVKIVKKKTDFPVRERIFLLLDATQTSVGGASGKFPQYYNAYYELVERKLFPEISNVGQIAALDGSAGVQFPRTPHTAVSSDHPSTQINLAVREVASGDRERSRPREEPQLSKGKQESPKLSDRNHPSSGVRPANLTVREVASANQESGTRHEEPQPQSRERKKDPQVAAEPSVIHKASAALEVLREVLNTISVENPEIAKDEFTLDLVEQCSFHKQQVMHLAMNSQDERWVAQAIELNEQLEEVLTRHDSLHLPQPQPISTPHQVGQIDMAADRHDQPAPDQPTPTSNHIIDHGLEEEEEAEQLSRRMRKGKARASPEDEEKNIAEKPFGLQIPPSERLHRPLIRPLAPLDHPPPSQEHKGCYQCHCATCDGNGIGRGGVYLILFSNRQYELFSTSPVLTTVHGNFSSSLSPLKNEFF
ncbi:hypothetical protein Dimus_012365 [Dionaea muscipula]